MGGTWDLFRYPGIRSDSDMHTLGFRFRPWTERQAIADGGPILEYVKSTAAMYGIDKHIRLNHKLLGADWSNADNRWTVQIEINGTPSTITCSFLFLCSGYYNYEQGYAPTFAGSEDFTGPIIHPQHWPEDLDYADKNIVVIGSGATAVTLVPALANSGAKNVTMLQRSPTYIVSSAEAGQDGRAAQPLVAREGGVHRGPLEEHPAAVGAVRGMPEVAAADAKNPPGLCRAPAARGL